MKTSFIITAAAVFAAAAASGCVMNPDTGATELFGLIPVDSALDVAETAANEAASRGGVVGLLGVVAGAAIAVYRRRKSASPSEEETRTADKE